MPGKASTQGSKAGAGSQSGGRVDKASGGNQGASGQGSKLTEALLKGDGGSTTGGKASTSAKGGPSEDSDRPPTAGVKGGKGLAAVASRSVVAPRRATCLATCLC